MTQPALLEIATETTNAAKSRHSGPIAGKHLSIRTGFKAISFKHAMFDGMMDPLVMVDHYLMGEPTFGAHPHAGMSAVTVLFEDSCGVFSNRDSLGNDIDLKAGDLYWLKAGSGAVHNEKPMHGALAHGLQMFVNLPAHMKHDNPEALHVKASEMPVIERDGAKVRLVLGESNGVTGAISPALPMTILDAKVDEGGRFEHNVAPGHSQWILAVDYPIQVSVGALAVTIPAGEAMAIRGIREPVILTLCAHTDCHAVIVTGQPIEEPFVQRGPFVMSTEAEIGEVESAYRSGRLGKLSG
ncbi:MAG: pirin-like C-terminal cupin domain-containing protein [Pseudomonadota bacterium]